jgi:hypothetical protein
VPGITGALEIDRLVVPRLAVVVFRKKPLTESANSGMMRAGLSTDLV